MSNFQDSFLSGSNIDFIEALYARFLEDPGAVDASWRELFERQRGQGRPIYMNGRGANGAGAPAADQAVGSTAGAPVTLLPAIAPMRTVAADLAPSPITTLHAKVAQAVYAFRLRGHLRAQLDPLGRPRP